MATLGEMYAKTENIHEIIKDFSNEIKTFEVETSKNIDSIRTIVDGMQWDSNLATKLKTKVNDSVEKINFSINEAKQLVEKLDKKAEGYSEILEKLKKAIAG